MSAVADTNAMNRPNVGRVALFVVLASESVFFATLLVAYIALRSQFNWPVQHSWVRLMFPLINTAILLLSVIPAWRAVVYIRKDRRSAAQISQVTVLLLGLLFVVGQIYEFNHAGLHVNDQTFGGVFFTLMGFHALHVLAGIIFVAINILRTRLGDFSVAHHSPMEIGAWFWYYVVAVWIVLFWALYLL